MSPNLSTAEPLKQFYGKSLIKDYKVQYNDKIFTKISTHFDIHRVEKIRNGHLYGMYLLSKEELQCNKIDNTQVKEKILYHVTSPQNAMKIARDNINWRRAKKSRFGKGSYFSRSPAYANRHSKNYGGIFTNNTYFKA